MLPPYPKTYREGDVVLVIIGIVVVLVSVIGGFILEGGPILVLIQLAEFLIIGGSAIGALLISTPNKLLKKLINNILKSLKGSKISKQTYLDVLKLLYELFIVIRKDGLIAIESHIEKPSESAIFQRYPMFLSQAHLINFLSEILMDSDIELHHAEGTKPGMILQKIGDSLPGLGIVAAVLGIVITMQAINGPPEEIGHKVAAALVGTFLGIFASYGFVQPLATNMDLANDDETGVFNVIKSGIICSAKGLNPIVAVEFARRSISSDFRPSFQEMESYVKEMK